MQRTLPMVGGPPPYNLSVVKLSRPTESNEPNFLRKLKGQYGGGNAVRHERPLARPKKQKAEDEDDAPTYVVEDSHDTMTRAEYEALFDQTGPQKSDEQQENGPNQHEDFAEKPVDREEEPTQKPANVKQHVAAIGASTKRKSAKIVGDVDAKANDGRGPESSAVPKTMKKPKKRVKLSFDDEVAEG